MAAFVVASPAPSEEPPRSAKVRVECPASPPPLHLTFRDVPVRAEDVITLAHALRECSPDELLAAILRHEAGWALQAEALERRTYAMLMRRITDALDAMAAISREAPPEREDQIIGPFWRFVPSGNRSLEHRMGAALYERAGASAARCLIEAGAVRTSTYAGLRDQMGGLAGKPEMAVAGCAALCCSVERLSVMEWDRALALPLWLPVQLSDQERYAVLARAFWALTYRGFTPDEVERGRPAGKPNSAQASARHRDPWPTDPVQGLLNHACWVDALEMWVALFETLVPGETLL